MELGDRRLVQVGETEELSGPGRTTRMRLSLIGAAYFSAMGMEGHLLGNVFAFAGLIGSAPLFLLFWDHPRAWHKPVIFILALLATFAWLIPAFIALCGIWSAY